MTEFDFFIRILQQSTERNKPKKKLTIKHLFNIAKMAKRNFERKEEEIQPEDVETFELLLKVSKTKRPSWLRTLKNKTLLGEKCYFIKRTN